MVSKRTNGSDAPAVVGKRTAARQVQASPSEGAPGSRWTLLTSHGLVLFYLASEPDATIREITDTLGISDRRVIAILHDLEAAGMIHSTRVGTRKHYEVNPDAHFRHPTLSHVPLRKVLDKLRARRLTPTPIRWRD